MNTLIHKSPVLLALKIIFLEVLIELIYLMVGALAYLVGQQFDYEVRLISPLSQLILLPFQVGILVYMLARWSNETYEVREEEIIMRQGIMRHVEKTYPYRNMQSVVVNQSFLERLVGAGTVSVFVPTLSTELTFTEVPSPKQFAESIKKAIPDEGNSQFIMRK